MSNNAVTVITIAHQASDTDVLTKSVQDFYSSHAIELGDIKITTLDLSDAGEADDPGNSESWQDAAAAGTVSQLVPYETYRIAYRTDTQRKDHHAVMQYLGRGRERGTTDWSVRPIAGTQTLYDRWIREVEKVPANTPRMIK